MNGTCKIYYLYSKLFIYLHADLCRLSTLRSSCIEPFPKLGHGVYKALSESGGKEAFEALGESRTADDVGDFWKGVRLSSCGGVGIGRTYLSRRPSASRPPDPSQTQPPRSPFCRRCRAIDCAREKRRKEFPRQYSSAQCQGPFRRGKSAVFWSGGCMART